MQRDDNVTTVERRFDQGSENSERQLQYFMKWRIQLNKRNYFLQLFLSKSSFLQVDFSHKDHVFEVGIA